MKLYNTASRQVEDLKPLTKGEIKLYTCGLTVYSHPHIGNWVVYIYWDILVRTLRASGYDVQWVQNITDVGHLTSDEDAGEDKMLASALKEGLTAWEVADKYIAVADNEAFELLKLVRPEHMPKATAYISQQIEFVQKLEEKGYTYKLKDGIYFDTSKVSGYGEMAHLDIKGLRFGARVADTGKKNPTDFAVWKFSDPAQKRDMEWDSPWGKGFPGWHLECSVMALEILGEQIDIHTGGVDHIPVHHTNEIAQTEAVTGKKFANLWLHANHIKVNGTKMSKSLGNIFTLQDVADKGYDLQAFKLLVISKHYRTEGNFTWEILDSAASRLARWQTTADLYWQTKNHDGTTEINLLQILQNDLDTPSVVAEIDSHLSSIEKQGLSANQSEIEKISKQVNDLLGINLLGDDINDEQKALISQREEARQSSDFAKSDALRAKLKEQGIDINDTDAGPIWSRLPGE